MRSKISLLAHRNTMLELANKTVNIFNSKIYYEITEDTSYAKHVHCTTCVH